MQFEVPPPQPWVLGNKDNSQAFPIHIEDQLPTGVWVNSRASPTLIDTLLAFRLPFEREEIRKVSESRHSFPPGCS